MTRALLLPQAHLTASTGDNKPKPTSRRPVSRCGQFNGCRVTVKFNQSSKPRDLSSRSNPAQWASGGGSDDGNNSGGGGGGGDGDGAGGSGGKDSGSLFRWKGWEERVATDPKFVSKVAIEQIIGVGSSVLGDMASRPNWGKDELDFVFATLVVGSIVNFSLMYFLAPTPASLSGTAGLNLLQKFFSEQTLTKMGAPGGHMFQPGFPVSKRLVNLAYKGGVFAFIGMCAGVIGTATSNGLLLLRKRLDPTFVQKNESPNVAANASTWALHMGVSSNVRYQILNGLDSVFQPMLPSTAFLMYSTAIRAVNNVIGGVSFVALAKAFGVQKASSPVEHAAKDAKQQVKKAVNNAKKGAKEAQLPSPSQRKGSPLAPPAKADKPSGFRLPWAKAETKPAVVVKGRGK